MGTLQPMSSEFPTPRGIIPPVPTPFTQSGELDVPALQRTLETLNASVDGFLILGSNGEAVFLSEDERRTALEAAREVIPEDKPMIAGTGGEATRLVEVRNEVAAEVGADYALVLAPHYYKGGMSDAVLRAHFERVADKSPLPVMLYNIPAATTLSLSPTLIAKLAEHGNIVGLKDSSGDVGSLTEIMRLVPDDFTVLTGNAPTLLAALSLGATGGILAVANVAAEVCREILAHFDKGELEEARALQLELNPLALAVTSRYGVPGLKALMCSQGVSAGYPRAPLLDVSEEVVRELEGLAKRAS